MRLGAPLYPRHRVLRLHSAIPYEAVVVFSCKSVLLAYALNDGNANGE